MKEVACLGGWVSRIRRGMRGLLRKGARFETVVVAVAVGAVSVSCWLTYVEACFCSVMIQPLAWVAQRARGRIVMSVYDLCDVRRASGRIVRDTYPLFA